MYFLTYIYLLYAQKLHNFKSAQ